MNFSDISPDFTKKFFELTTGAKRVVIAGHVSPDDDSISSVMAVYEVLQQKQPGLDVQIMYTGVPDDRYKTFKHYDKIQFVPDIADAMQPSDTLIVVDGSQLHRFSHTPQKLAAMQTKICIDHHASPIDKFTLSLVAPTYPAAAEVIYRSFAKDIKLNKQVAELFLLGILGDTGTFKYLKTTHSGTLVIAKELMDAGDVNIQELQARYDKIKVREFEVLQEFIKNSRFAKVPGWPDFQYSFVTREFRNTGNYTDEEVSGGSGLFKSDYVRKLDGYTWGVSIWPGQTGDVYISGRSLPGSVNVRDIMERLQIGGGHDRAAGGTLKKTTKDLDAQDGIDLVLDWASKNKPVLS